LQPECFGGGAAKLAELHLMEFTGLPGSAVILSKASQLRFNDQQPYATPTFTLPQIYILRFQTRFTQRRNEAMARNGRAVLCNAHLKLGNLKLGNLKLGNLKNPLGVAFSYDTHATAQSS
jgi:hypothetical protein